MAGGIIHLPKKASKFLIILVKLVGIITRDCLYKLQYQSTHNRFEALVKIRYNMQAQKAIIELNNQNNTAKLTFTEPISSITSGQAAVFYDINDKHLIGGGWID